MSDIPEKPTPDSAILWAEFGEITASPEWAEFNAASSKRSALEKRSKEIEKRILDLLPLMSGRVKLALDITAQVTAMRFELREAALMMNQAIHIDSRLSKALMAVSEKIAALVNEENL